MNTTAKKRGIVKFFNKTKGFGFIVDNETGKDIFTHVSGIVNRNDDLKMDDTVEFTETEGRFGKGVMAVGVQKVA